MDKLILQAKNGDQLAIEEIVSRYKGLVRSLANKFYLVGGNKDDLLQEGMLGLFYAVNGYDEDKGSFPSFAEICVYRQILDAVKKDGNFKNKPLYNYVDLESVEHLADPTNPLESLLRKEYAEKVAAVISDRLTPFEKQVLNLFAAGYSYELIADMTGRSYKSVDGALQRARKKLSAFANA